MTNNAVEFNSIDSGQAQHLIKRKEELTGKITRLPIGKPKQSVWHKIWQKIRGTVMVLGFIAYAMFWAGVIGV